MLKVSDYAIYFRHEKPKKKHSAPKSTTCIIKRNETLLAKAHSRPVTEIPVIIEDPRDIDLLGRKVRKVHRMDDGTRLVILSGDNFSYSQGRKTALTKAMTMANIPRNERKAIWKTYKRHCK